MSFSKWLSRQVLNSSLQIITHSQIPSSRFHLTLFRQLSEPSPDSFTSSYIPLLKERDLGKYIPVAYKPLLLQEKGLGMRWIMKEKGLGMRWIERIMGRGNEFIFSGEEV